VPGALVQIWIFPLLMVLHSCDAASFRRSSAGAFMRPPSLFPEQVHKRPFRRRGQPYGRSSVVNLEADKADDRSPRPAEKKDEAMVGAKEDDEDVSETVSLLAALGKPDSEESLLASLQEDIDFLRGLQERGEEAAPDLEGLVPEAVDMDQELGQDEEQPEVIDLSLLDDDTEAELREEFKALAGKDQLMTLDQFSQLQEFQDLIQAGDLRQSEVSQAWERTEKISGTDKVDVMGFLEAWMRVDNLFETIQEEDEEGEMVESLVKKKDVRAGDMQIIDADKVSDEWELDFYSRPIKGADGKKIWEVLITDKTGNFKYAEVVPTRQVNSRALKELFERVADDAPTRPKVVRFFRAQMQSMIKIGLSAVSGIDVRPSRATYRLYDWLDEREKKVYPSMAGYDASLISQFFPLDFEPERLPDEIMCEKFAFAQMPLSEIADETRFMGNIATKLCPLPTALEEGSADASDIMIPGIVMFASRRAQVVASLMMGKEIGFLKAYVTKRQLCLEAGLDDSFLLCGLDDELRRQAADFERQKLAALGLHFFAIQASEEKEPVAFWLLRENIQDDDLLISDDDDETLPFEGLKSPARIPDSDALTFGKQEA